MPDTTTDYRARSVARSSVAAHHQTASTFAVVLAGGRNSRLKPLTDWRAKPAMPFGSKLKIIDFAPQLHQLGRVPKARRARIVRRSSSARRRGSFWRAACAASTTD